MRQSGWFKESYRHKLAAHGIQTSRYFAKKGPKMTDSLGRTSELPKNDVPSSVEDEAPKKSGILGLFPKLSRYSIKTESETLKKAKELVPEVEEAKRVYGTTVGKAAYDAQMGSPTTALDLLASGKISAQNASYLKSSLMQYAVSRVQSDLPVPDAVKAQLDTSQTESLKKIEESRKPDTAGKKVVRELEQKAVVSALETPGIVAGAAGGALAGGIAAEGEFLKDAYGARVKRFPGEPGSDTDFPGVTEVGDKLGGSPFLTDNFLFPASSKTGTQPPKGGAMNDVKGIFDNIGAGGKEKSYAEKVQERVDTLFYGKDQLSQVDEETPYRKGTEEFEKGNREGLIDSIVDLKSQEGTLRDRWAFVSAAHNQLVSVQNNESMYGDTKGNIALSSFFGNGATRMTDQTKKLNAVKSDIKKANDRVFNRRRLLEYRLQRMDASVPPEVGAPEEVNVLSQRSNALSAVVSVPAFMQRAETLITDVGNPVLRRDG